MSLIEGVGDEVTDFFIVVGVLLVGWIAWCSTNISEQPLIRTVLILQHRTRTRIAEFRSANHTTSTVTINTGVTNTSSTRASSSDETLNEETVETSTTVNPTEQDCSIDQADAAPQVPTDDSNPAEATTASEATASEEVLIEAMDSLNDDESLLRKTPKIPKPDTAATDNISDFSQSVPVDTSQVDSNDDNISSQGDEMTIKLKFINDDQKLVTGRPKENLGDFKRRHFQVELEAQKRVRLVFNGHVLQPDSETLEQCGLFDNCVVHCLVHQQRVPITATSGNSSSGSNENFSTTNSSPQAFQNIQTGSGILSANEWDLSRVLVSVLTVILAFAWYSRYYYAQLFTATTTLALYGLSAIFALTLVGHFFPDQDSVRHIE